MRRQLGMSPSISLLWNECLWSLVVKFTGKPLFSYLDKLVSNINGGEHIIILGFELWKLGFLLGRQAFARGPALSEQNRLRLCYSWRFLVKNLNGT